MVLTSCLVLMGVLYVMAFRRPILYEIPGDYKGWVVVRFGVSRCSALPTRGLFQVVSVAPSGKACTSSPDPTTYTRFDYVYPDGRRKSLPWSTGGDESTGPMAWMISYMAES